MCISKARPAPRRYLNLRVATLSLLRTIRSKESEWHTFTDFPHFIEIYIAVSNCLRTPNEIELINREFLQGQAAQHILHSEVTYTALTLYKMHGISLEDQLAAINRARVWAADELNTTMTLTFDIAREVGADDGLITANWAIRRIGTSSPNPSRQRTPCTHSRQVLLCANPTHHLLQFKNRFCSVFAEI